MRLKTIDGMPVIDVRRPVLINVTASDIARADRKDPSCCAMARACKREMHVRKVRIHLGRVYVSYNGKSWVRYMTPSNLRINIICFDQGGKFNPGEFRLAPPQPSKRPKGKRMGSNKNGKSGRKRSYVFAENVRSGPA